MSSELSELVLCIMRMRDTVRETNVSMQEIKMLLKTWNKVVSEISKMYQEIKEVYEEIVKKGEEENGYS